MFAFVGRTDDGAIEFASTVTDTRLRLESEEQAGQAITFVQNDQDIVCPLSTRQTSRPKVSSAAAPSPGELIRAPIAVPHQASTRAVSGLGSSDV